MRTMAINFSFEGFVSPKNKLGLLIQNKKLTLRNLNSRHFPGISKRRMFRNKLKINCFFYFEFQRKKFLISELKKNLDY